jgi:hypothetical protein
MCGQPEEVERAAKDLVAALTRQPSPHPMYFGEHLVLRVQDPKGMTEENIPSDAMIVDRSNGSLALFDKLAVTWKWGDLEEEARKTLDQRWLRELAQAMHLASRGKTFDPVQATFSARRGGKVYRPILHRLDHLADGSMDFKILFEEDVSWNLKDMPTDIAVALTAQVMAIRFRYEVLQKYDSALDTIDLDDSDDSREGVFREIRHAVEMIDVEARSRGFLKKDLLAKIFDGNRERVCELFDEWCSVKTKLLESCEKMDAAETRCLIQDLLNYNTEFIPMAADYYHKLVEEALDGDKFAIPIK